MKLDPRAEELIKEFEEELATLYSYGEPTGITVIGPVLHLYEEAIDIYLTKLSDKEYLVHYIDEDGLSHVKICKSPDEVHRFLGWTWKIYEIRRAEKVEKELSEEEKDKLRKYLREGYDIASIYKTTGISPSCIYFFAKVENLPIKLPIKVKNRSERR
jgi:hypothetical protein